MRTALTDTCKRDEHPHATAPTEEDARVAPNVAWQTGWAPILLGPIAVVAFVPDDWPRWAFMWMLAFALYAGCKWLTWRRTPAPGAPLWRHVGYLLAWPGMDAAAFLRASSRAELRSAGAMQWSLALGNLAAGAVLFWGVARFVPPQYAYPAGWVGMIGFVLMLHFGLFHLLSCGWRAIGVEARPLMNRPLASRSISQFWSVRWNTAFRDLTHRFLFRPLVGPLGPRSAVLVGFLVSGLIHDLVISMPARGGYGGPTLFFLMQALAMLVARSPIGRRIGLQSGLGGWLFTMLALLLPAGLLFHPPFVHRVVLPFMTALGAV